MLAGAWLVAILGGEVEAASPKESFNFQEVYELLKANLAGASEAELNQAAVRGLLDQLAGKVSVIGESPRVPAVAGTNPPVSAVVVDRQYGYFRVHRLVAGSAADFQSAYDQMVATNKLRGLVLDLRFTGGQDYPAALALADRFFAGEQPLVDWGEGWKKSTPKSNAVALPVAILVNRKTTGAAEALAGMLRHREIGLLIGSNTAGQASVAKDFVLKTGQRLRLAVAPLRVADDKELPFSGIRTDIEVEVRKPRGGVGHEGH